jgi:hypothetical protein
MAVQIKPRRLDPWLDRRFAQAKSLLSRLSKPKDKSLKDKLSHIGRVTEKKGKR